MQRNKWYTLVGGAIGCDENSSAIARSTFAKGPAEPHYLLSGLNFYNEHQNTNRGCEVLHGVINHAGSTLPNKHTILNLRISRAVI